MAQVTALEWFWIHLDEDISKEYFDLFEQAKQMEKEQIERAYIDYHNLGHIYGLDTEQYYNETYNK